MVHHTNQRNYKTKSNPSEDKKPLIIGSSNEIKSMLFSPYWRLSYDFPWNPDPLAPGNNYDVYDEMHNDDQVKSALSIKKDMVVNTGWIVQGDNPDVNDFVVKTLENINEGTNYDHSFDDILRDMLSSYGYGFSLSEPVHSMKDGKVIYKSLRTRPPHSFLFDLDDYGTLLQIRQVTTKGDLKFKPSTFLHHVYQMEFGNPYGKSDLRAAYNAWKAKKYFTRFFAVYVEKYASPPLVGKYPKTYSSTEIDDFYNTIKSAQNATTFAIPDDVMIEFVQTSRDASDVYLRGLDYYNMQIARSILVPDLLGLGGTETKGGSFALGKEQFKVFLASIKKDRESLERKITMKLVRPLVLANFGDIPCWFEFKPYTFDDVSTYLDLWIKAVTGRIYKPNDDEINYFRSATGFPEGDIQPAAGPPTTGGPRNGNADAANNPGMGGENMPGQIPGQPGQPGSNEPAKPAQSKEDQDQAGKEKADITAEKEFAFRPLRPAEKKVNFKKIENILDKGNDKTVKKSLTAMRKMYLDLIDQVQSKNLLTKFKPQAIENLKPRFQKDLNIIFRNYYEDLFIESYNEAQAEVIPDQSAKFAVDLLPEEFLELLKVESFKNVGDYSFQITKKAKNIIFQGIKDGTPQSEIMKTLRESLSNESEVWANTVIRTKTNEIFNEARKSFYEQDPIAKQIVVGYEWSAILDDRTSTICQDLDGDQFTIETSQRIKPPAHFNCRSVLVPITKFEDFKPTDKRTLQPASLQKKGGGLLTRKFNGEGKPTLTNASMINIFGETVIIAAPGEGRRLNIVAIQASNVSLENPVVVGFKGQDEAELKYKVLLNFGGGIIQKDFNESPYILNDNTGFIIDLSAPVDVEYTIDYTIDEINAGGIL